MSDHFHQGMSWDCDSIDIRLINIEVENKRLKENCIELQQEINCLRMEPCQLSHCVEEKKRLKKELKETQRISDEHVLIFSKDGDKWKSRCEELAAAIRKWKTIGIEKRIERYQATEEEKGLVVALSHYSASEGKWK